MVYSRIMNKYCIDPLILWVSGCGYRVLFFWSVEGFDGCDILTIWAISCRKVDFFFPFITIK